MKTTRLWEKISYVLGILPIGAIFGILTLAAMMEIRDLDLWLHLAMGKFILQNHLVPAVDILSCSIQGKPWINHEWLFQVIAAVIFRQWGPEGLLRMQMLVVILTMLFLLFLGYNKEKQLTAIFVLFLLGMVYQQRFTIRPDIFSLLFFAVYIFVLALHIDKKWAPAVLFCVQFFWVNMHGFFFFGPLFAFIGLISEWLKRHVRLPFEWNQSGRLTDAEYRRLKFITLGVVCACFLNPYTVQGALYPLTIFFSLGEHKIFFEKIEELQKPVTWETLWHIGRFSFYKLMILLSAVSFIFNRRRLDISALIFWLVFLVFSLLAARNMAFFAFAAFLVIITNTLNFSYKNIIPIRFTQKRFQDVSAVIAKVLFLLFVFHHAYGMSAISYYDFGTYSYKSEFGGLTLRNYPDKAVDFLVENKIRGNFFNDFNSGAYLLGHCYPDIKVFIDGRTEVYGAEFFEKYQRIWDKGDTDLFEQIVEKFQITGAFLGAVRHQIPSGILQYLQNHEDWRLVYLDYDAVIFLKNIPAHQDVIRENEIELSAWESKDIDLFKLGTVNVLPYQYYFRAHTLESLNAHDAALAEAQTALQISPSYGEPYGLIGKIYAGREEFKKAFEYFRIAVMFSPANQEMRYNLALSLSDLGRYESAIQEYEVIARLRPGDPKPHFFLAKTFAITQQFSDSVESLEKAKPFLLAAVPDLLSIGDIIFEHEAYEDAKIVYEFALFPDGTKQDVVHLKLSEVYQALGDPQRAKEELEKALAINPKNQDIQEKLKEFE